MPSRHKRRDTGCPVAFALDTFGDRWSLVVIRDMLMQGHRTYSEFLESDEGIATNVLADRLRDLDAAGIISKARDPENRRRIIYRLTEKGADLAPVLVEMIRWGGKYDRNSKVTKAMLKRIKQDRDGFAEQLRNRALSDQD